MKTMVPLLGMMVLIWAPLVSPAPFAATDASPRLLAAGGVTDLATLRRLLDPETFEPTDTTTLFTAEGVVTTHANLTDAPNVLFYMQDATAGVAVFWRGGAAQFLPKAGDRVRVVGPLTHFNGLLEFAPDTSRAETSVTRLDENQPLPVPLELDFTWSNDADVIDPREGSRVAARDVWVDLTTPNFVPGSNVTLTNADGATFVLRIDARTDIGGQPKPTSPVTVLGVLGQFDTSRPRTGGYQLIVSRYADILASAKAPTVRFTNSLDRLIRPGELPANTFSDQVLRPGEQLTLWVHVTDPEGRVVQVDPVTTGLPASAQWDFDERTGTHLTGTLVFVPTAAEAGQMFPVTLRAWNVAATNTTVWQVYVPNAEEQHVILTEYLANPTANPEAPHFNPLRRDPPTDNTSQHDEYVELVNLSAADVDLTGWSIADGVGVRHRFEAMTLSSSNAVVVYGGPLNGLLPNLEVGSVPASESSAGLALNNNGDTIAVRNAAGHLVLRVVYPDTAVVTNGSMSRYPHANGPFVPQAAVSALAVSPGAQADGKPWSEPANPVGEITGLQATLESGRVVILWHHTAEATYTVLAADLPTGPYSPVGTGLTTGRFEDPTSSARAARFFRVQSP